MPRAHDRGGWPDPTPIDRSEHQLAWWEKKTDALGILLSDAGKRVFTVDERRRWVEGMQAAEYESASYYQRWLASLEGLLIEKGLVSRAEIDREAAALEARQPTDIPPMAHPPSAHDAGHDHDHDDSTLCLPTLASPEELRIEAIQALLVARGVITANDVRRVIEEMDGKGEALGGRVVARAWVDPAFRARLRANPKAAVAELGIDASLRELAVLENTERIHHVVVCTLCSCYPRSILGRPPDWYKSLAYRARVVMEPRAVLREFGLELSPDVEVRVVDSTADMRYLVIPLRPAGTEGWGEDALAALVSRDSMIGVASARTPAAAGVD